MIHIQRFLDKLKNLQDQNAKEMTMSIHEANKLHADITRLLMELKQIPQEPVTEVELTGGKF